MLLTSYTVYDVILTNKMKEWNQNYEKINAFQIFFQKMTYAVQESK